MLSIDFDPRYELVEKEQLPWASEMVALTDAATEVYAMSLAPGPSYFLRLRRACIRETLVLSLFRVRKQGCEATHCWDLCVQVRHRLDKQSTLEKKIQSQQQKIDKLEEDMIKTIDDVSGVKVAVWDRPRSG